MKEIPHVIYKHRVCLQEMVTMMMMMKMMKEGRKGSTESFLLDGSELI